MPMRLPSSDVVPTMPVPAERVTETAYRSMSLEGAHEIGEQTWYPHTLEQRVVARTFTFAATKLDLGAVRLGTLYYSTPIHVSTAPYVDWYQVNVALRGTVRTAVGDRNVETTPSRAAIYGHDVDTAFSGFERPSVMLCAKLDRAAVDAVITRVRSDREAQPFGTLLDVSHGPGKAWLGLARRIIEASRRPDGIDPVLATHLAERLVMGLVVSTLPEPAGRLMSLVDHERAIDRAVEAIEFAHGAPLGLETVAALAGVTGRALQQSFQQAMGMSPMSFQTSVRLERVQTELRKATPGKDRVADIATRHGFTHLGRFAAQYARAFGERPSETLRR